MSKLIILISGFTQLIIFPEGTTTNNKGMLDLKRGPFDIGSPVKFIGYKYGTSNMMPFLTMFHVSDMIYLLPCQLFHSVTEIELMGNYYPKEFTDWKEFSAKSKELMCKEFGLANCPVRMKDVFEFNKKYCPLRFNYSK